MSSLEQDAQVSGNITENGATYSGPQAKPPSKKKSAKNTSVKKAKSISKEVSNAQTESDGRATSEMASQDKALHNYSQANGEGNEESSKPLTKKKSKTSKMRLAKIEGKSAEEDGATTPSKEPNDPIDVQELRKLKECLECQWAHNYHPCLLSDRADNQRCKDEMKRKGYEYEEPKQQCCLKKGTCDVNTAENAVAEEQIVSATPPLVSKPKKQPFFKKSKQKPKPATVNNNKLSQEKSTPEVVVAKESDENSKPQVVPPKQADEQYKPPIVTSKQTEGPYKPPILKTKRKDEESKPVIAAPKPTPEPSKPTIIVSRPTQAAIVFSKPNQDHSKPPIVVSKTNQEQSELPPKQKKTPSVKIKPSSSKIKAHVNFDKETPPKTASTASLKKKQSKTNSKLKGVKPVSSKQDTALDLLNKMTSKSSKKLGGEKHASSVPVSTRESKTRFNPRQPSPSDTNLPPVTISASQVKCFNPEMTTSTGTGICETPAPAPPGKTKSKTKSAKSKKTKEKDAIELVAEGEKPACEWHKNYHPCDKPNNNKEGEVAIDQIICKAWKKKLKELDPQAKSTKSSSKSIVEAVQSNALTTTPSEKAYIDKVVRTAVKLAKKNNPTRRRRRSRVDSFSSGFSRVSSVVDNAINAAAAVVHTHPRPMTAKRSKRTAGN